MTTLLDTRRPRALLTVLCMLLWMPGFFTVPPGDRDESRFAQATKQMLETGDYVRIMNGTEARNRKPIGIYWLQLPFVAAAHELGLARQNPIWPYRVPSALGGLLAVLACFEAGLALVGRRAALLGAGMLAAAVVLVTEVHIAKTDAALLGATTAAMAVLGRAYLDPGRVRRPEAALFWLAIGLGVLLKGPITPMIAGLAVLALLMADRGAPWLRCLRAGWGVPLMLAVVLPWFVAIELATHGAFVSDAVAGDLGRKLASGDDAHWGPPGLHLLLLPVLLFPATAAVPAGVAAAWATRRERPTRFLLAWIGPAWLVFEAAPTKLPHYTLPLYPAVCLLLAHGLVACVRVGAWRWLGAGLAALVAAALAVGAVAVPWFLDGDPWLGGPASIAALLAGWFAVRSGRGRMAAAAALAASVPLYAAVLGYELPRLWPLWIGPRVVAAVPAGRLGAVGYAEPSLMFLAGTGTQWLLADAGAAGLADGRLDVLLVGDRDLAAVQAALLARGTKVRVVDEIRGFNYSRGRRVTLTALAVPQPDAR
jgi:4-amino-4-deoxy-L-arabinose transferase-like glycosyltransferase